MKELIFYWIKTAYIVFFAATILVLVAGILFPVSVASYMPFAVFGLISFGLTWVEFEGQLFLERIIS